MSISSQSLILLEEQAKIFPNKCFSVHVWFYKYLSLDCQEGFFYNHTLKICVACPLGTYQWSKGQDTCRQCPDGQTTSNNGNQDKMACFLGKIDKPIGNKNTIMQCKATIVGVRIGVLKSNSLSHTVCLSVCLSLIPISSF